MSLASHVEQTLALGDGVELRAVETLALMHRWGYTPTLDALASSLVGGGVSRETLLASITGSHRIRTGDGFVFLDGHEHLVRESKRRVETHETLNGAAWTIARDFTRDLLSVCPQVECVMLSGSVASGGYAPADDVDFDLIVRGRTKYTSYLIATLVGLRYAWRYRHVDVEPVHRTPFLPKVTCINVVWTDLEARPFVRQDIDMAFELMRCRPLFGAARFREVLEANPWILAFFPQSYEQRFSDEVSAAPGAIANVVSKLARVPGTQALVEAASRGFVWGLYRFVQWTRRGNPEAARRNEFLRRVKFPYEVLQD